MIQVLDNSMVYVTKDEKKTIDQLYRIKKETAIYYKNGIKIAYHWILNPVTVARLKLTNK